VFDSWLRVANRDLTSHDDLIFDGFGVRQPAPGPLTLEEHQELGTEMKSINARLRELCKVIVSVYGPNTQAAFTFLKAAEHIDRLCQDLQAQAARDLPGYPVDGMYL